MKFLITGGAGFIGSHLCDSLLNKGNEVIILDNLTTGRQENVSPKATFVFGEVTDSDLVYDLICKVDGCFHLAAIPSVEQGHQNWLGCNHVNLVGSLVIFDAVKKMQKKKIPVIYASSAAVYGNNPLLPLNETSLLEPLSAYGVDKLSSELHAKIATSIHGIPTIGLRFFNVFGPRQDPSSPYSGVISIFIERFKANQHINIYGDGEQTRDFIFVGDVVEGLIAAFNHKNKSTAEIYNICTGFSTSINQLAREIAFLLKKNLKVIHEPPKPGDIRHSLGDPTKAHKILGFKAAYDLRQGLAQMLQNVVV